MYFKAIWSILWPFGIFCGHLVHFMAIRHIFPVLVCCNKEKSGNPERVTNSSDNLKRPKCNILAGLEPAIF
jgi:hypothetical protein